MVNIGSKRVKAREPGSRIGRSRAWGAALAATLIAAAVLSISCNVNGVGIFYGLQNERKIATSGGLSTKLTIGSMVLVSGYYYAATGKIYVASNNQGIGATLTWTALPSPVSGAICTQLVSMTAPGGNGPLYAIFVSDSAPTVASISGSALVYQGTVNPADGTVSWTKDPAFANLYAQNLIVAGPAATPTLFVDASTTVQTDSTTTDTQYSLYWDNGGAATLVTLGGATTFTSPVIAGAYEQGTTPPTTGSYWFASGSQLYQSTIGTTTPGSATYTANAPAPPSGLSPGNLQFSAIYYSPGTAAATGGGLGALFASTRNGYLYAYVDASAGWTAASTVANSGSLVGLNGIIDTGTLFGSTDAVLVGSDIGYFEMDLTAGSLTSSSSLSLVAPNGDNDLSTDLNYTAASLHDITILNFLLDSTNLGDVRIFALTAGGAATVTGGGGGLWRNEPTGSGTRTWSQD